MTPHAPLTHDQIVAIENRATLRTYRRWPISLVRGEGSHVWDAGGERYLDMYGGHAVALTGHAHPRVVAALREQAGRLLFYSNVVTSDVRARAVARLEAIAPAGLGRAFLASTGSEANETALKIARRHTGRRWVISFEGGFHGRTLGALSAVGLDAYREGVAPLVAEHRVVPFGDLDAVRRAGDDQTAAILIEPVQSMAGARVAEAAFYQGLREVATATGALLIFDEVQTAPGRTGHPFAGTHWDVTPDLITTAKGLASGVPCAVTLVRDEIADRIGYGEQGTTFGGGMLAMAAMEATLAVLADEDLPGNAVRRRRQIEAETSSIPGVEAVHGLGLLVGLRVAGGARRVAAGLFERRVLATTSPGDPDVLRLLPPLTLTEADTGAFLAALRSVMEAG